MAIPTTCRARVASRPNNRQQPCSRPLHRPPATVICGSSNSRSGPALFSPPARNQQTPQLPRAPSNLTDPAAPLPAAQASRNGANTTQRAAAESIGAAASRTAACHQGRRKVVFFFDVEYGSRQRDKSDNNLGGFLQPLQRAGYQADGYFGSKDPQRRRSPVLTVLGPGDDRLTIRLDFEQAEGLKEGIACAGRRLDAFIRKHAVEGAAIAMASHASFFNADVAYLRDLLLAGGSTLASWPAGLFLVDTVAMVGADARALLDQGGSEAVRVKYGVDEGALLGQGGRTLQALVEVVRAKMPSNPCLVEAKGLRKLLRGGTARSCDLRRLKCMADVLELHVVAEYLLESRGASSGLGLGQVAQVLPDGCWQVRGGHDWYRLWTVLEEPPTDHVIRALLLEKQRHAQPPTARHQRAKPPQQPEPSPLGPGAERSAACAPGTYLSLAGRSMHPHPAQQQPPCAPADLFDAARELAPLCRATLELLPLLHGGLAAGGASVADLAADDELGPDELEAALELVGRALRVQEEAIRLCSSINHITLPPQGGAPAALLQPPPAQQAAAAAPGLRPWLQQATTLVSVPDVPAGQPPAGQHRPEVAAPPSCGAVTRNGTACMRRVTEHGLRCHQHAGMRAKPDVASGQPQVEQAAELLAATATCCATTQQGKPCKRVVPAPGMRCWQH